MFLFAERWVIQDQNTYVYINIMSIIVNLQDQLLFYSAHWCKMSSLKIRHKNATSRNHHGQNMCHGRWVRPKTSHRGVISQRVHAKHGWTDDVWSMFYHSGKLTVGPWIHSLVLMETHLPTPMTARVYVNLPEGTILILILDHFDSCRWIRKGVRFNLATNLVIS